MKKYFFHPRDANGTDLRDKGVELANINAVRETAIASARAIISELLKEGRTVDGYSFTVKDDAGEQVMVYDFKIYSTAETWNTDQ